MGWRDSYRYLIRLNVPATEAERSRVETNLGLLRVILASLALTAFLIDVPEPTQFKHLVCVLLAIWVLYSILVLAWVCRRPVSTLFLSLLHVGDILWLGLITVFSHGASSPFIPLYTFVLVSAGFRWGFPEALLTTVAGGVLLEMEAIFLTEDNIGSWGDDHLLLRCACLFGLGYMIGVLGENEKERRAESAVVTRMIRAAWNEHSLAAVLHAVFAEFGSLFDSKQIFLITHDLTTDQVYLWSSPSAPNRDALPHSREILSESRLTYILPEYAETFYCEQRSGKIAKFVELNSKTHRRSINGHIPSLPFLPAGAKSLLAVTAYLGQEWQLRLLLVDARLGNNAHQELTFARSLFEQAASTIYGVYLVRRLRARASALERARVARELHDGAIQSLIATEMRANILRRRAEKDFPTIAPEIASLEILLQNQVIELRELMQQLKPVKVAPDQLLDHIAEQVDRFRRDSGIAARFVSAAEEVHLSAYTCREILLIVQEALINIRKHAKAAAVHVSFSRHEGGWQLSVIDDGIGFGFEGTLAGAELMKSAKGPATIKERVANLGGELSITSQAPRGSQLLIKLPLKGSFAHG